MNARTTFSTPLRLLGQARADDRGRASRFSLDAPGGSTPPQFDEPSLFYDPPYADRLHDEFAWHLVKYLKRGSGLRYRVAEATLRAVDLTVDFVVERGPRRVGFMCSPSAADAAPDRLTDALRIQYTTVDVLYRLRARDVERHLHDVLLLAAKWDAPLFSKRGRANLNTLATPEARAARPRRVDTVASLRYGGAGAASAAPSSDGLRVVRLSRTHPEGWMQAYERARAHLGITDPPRGWARSA